MTKVAHGRVRGNSIELDEAIGIPEGQEVQVTIHTVSAGSPKSGEGFIRTEGALANDTEWDAIMDEIHQTRKQERRPQSAELEGA